MTIRNPGPSPVGTGTGAGRPLRARAPGGQVATPDRWEMLMRFKLWQQANEHGLEHHETPDEIADDYGVARTLL